MIEKILGCVRTAEETTRALVDVALQNGGKDYVTVIAVKVEKVFCEGAMLMEKDRINS